MAIKDPRLSPEAWGGEFEEEFILGNPVVQLMNSSRDGVVSSLRYGDVCLCYLRDGEWSLIAAKHDGYVGWARDVIERPMNDQPRLRVSNVATHIYPAPDMKRTALGRLSLGSWVENFGQDGDFTKIGEREYIFSQHLINMDNVTSFDAVDYALQFLGTPYLWGGGTSDGIDCSGLTQLCYSFVGKAIPRDTDQQESALEAISRDEARRGDLVYWKGHVGILEDENTMIHATAFAMKTIREDLEQAINRIGEPTSICKIN